MPKRPFFHSPDEAFDLGILGERFMTFAAIIQYFGEESEPLVFISSALVEFKMLEEQKRTLDVTALIHSDSERLEKFKQIILSAWREERKRQWDSEEGA